VLAPRPSYPLFEHLAGLDGVALEPFDLVQDAGRWRVDFDSLERAATPGTRAVLVVSPNNPTGSCLSPDEIARLGAFCAARSLALVGDEVFAGYSWSGAAPPSVLTQRSALTFVLGGLSKSCGLPQLKLGWIAAGGPEPLVREALERLEIACDAYLSVATPVQLALPSLLSAGALVRDRIRARIATNLAALDAALLAGPPALAGIDRPRTVLPSSESLVRLPGDAGWYAVLALPHSVSEEPLVLSLLERDRVLVHPGWFFDFASDGFVVVSLLPPPGVLARGVAALSQRATD
jgi:alanine-synthesizing transaminase